MLHFFFIEGNIFQNVFTIITEQVSWVRAAEPWQNIIKMLSAIFCFLMLLIYCFLIILKE